MKAAEQQQEQAEQQQQQQQETTSNEAADETPMDQDDLVDQMVADEQQMLNEEVVETVVQNEEVSWFSNLKSVDMSLFVLGGRERRNGSKVGRWQWPWGSGEEVHSDQDCFEWLVFVSLLCFEIIYPFFSQGQSEEGEDPSQGKFVVLEKENGQNAQNEQLSDDDDVKNQEVDHETTVEMEQIVEDDETVELTPYTEKSHNGKFVHSKSRV